MSEEDAPGEAAAPAWATTFGDLMSLLLVFFVLVASFAQVDARRFGAMAKSLQGAFDASSARPGALDAPAASVPDASAGDATLLPSVRDRGGRGVGAEQSLVGRVRMAIRERRLERVVEVESTPRGVVLRAHRALLFDPGSAELRSQALGMLHEVAELMRGVPGELSIEGHAAEAEPAGSPWELSVARAVVALRHLIDVERFEPGRLRATGYGATRPRFANTGPSARAANRRVEFVLLRAKAEADAPALEAVPEEQVEEERKIR